MKIKSMLKKYPILVILLGIILGTASFAAISNNDRFPKNERGETYGSIKDLAPNEKGPDLIQAYTVDGKLGYVRAEDFFGEPPKTPDDALKTQAVRSTREINVYESDGKTVIGKFLLEPAKVSYDGKKPSK